jgi:hypothetical protein
MKQKSKLVTKTKTQKKQQKLSPKFIIGTIILLISLFIIVIFSNQQLNITGNAQIMPTAIVPTFGTIGDCHANGTCPTNEPQPTVISPAVVNTNDISPTAPCVSQQSEQVSIMTENRQHIASNNSGFLQLILQFLQQLLQLIEQLLGGNTTTPTPVVTPSPTIQPSVTTQPTQAVQPTTIPVVTSVPCPPTNTPQPTTTAQQPTAIPSSAPVPTSPTTSSSCTNPTDVIQQEANNPQNGITINGYYVDTDTWNAAKYPVTQTVYVCNYNSWYVVANMNNNSGDGAVKTYPDVQKIFTNTPISSINSLTSSYADVPPPPQDFEFAYDIWINNMSTELMIWTDAFGSQASAVNSYPSFGTVTLGGISYNVHKSGSFVIYQMTNYNTSGTVDIKAVFNDMISRGFIPSSSTLGQLEYGVELVSTGGVNETFQFTNFSVNNN